MLNPLTQGLMKIFKGAAKIYNDDSQLDDYREIAIFKYVADNEIKNGTADFTQEDVNEIFGLYTSINKESSGFIHYTTGNEKKAQEAYRNGTLSRKEVTDLTEATFGTAIADAGSAYDDAIANYMKKGGYNELTVEGKTYKFSEKAELYLNRARLDDIYWGSTSLSIDQKLTKSEGSIAGRGPKSCIEFNEAAEQALGMPLEEFMETYKEEIALLDDIVVQLSTSGKLNIPEDKQEVIAEISKKIKAFNKAGEELSQHWQERALQSRNQVVEIAKAWEDAIKQMRENVDVQGEVEEPTGLVGRYYQAAVNYVYEQSSQSGIEQVTTTSQDFTTKKVKGDDGRVYIEITNTQTGEKEVWNMNGQRVK